MNIAKDFKLDAIDFANQGNTCLGIRGSGKTYGASKLAEELMDAKIPFVTFDPTGVWKNLRNGINGNPGYPVVVVGGMHPDIPLTEETAVDILHSALKAGVSIIFDFRGISTSSKGKWVNIVGDCVEFLLGNNEQYGLRHVFIEEAAEFVPQKLDSTPRAKITYSRIESLARMGRNFGLGYTLINQRAEEISKAILEICEQVFVFRQAGKNSLKSIKDWLDYRGLEDSRGIVQSLPKLEAGECWVINQDVEQRIRILPKKTFHPNPKEHIVKLPANVVKADVTKFIQHINELMAESGVDATPVPVKATKEAKNRITELEKELQRMDNDYNIIGQMNEALKTENIELRNRLHSIANIATIDIEPPKLTNELVNKMMSIPVTLGKHPNTENMITKKEVEQLVSDDLSGGAAAIRMLKAAAMFPAGIAKSRMAIIAGIKVSGSTFRNGISKLNTSGYITGNGLEGYVITAEGKKVAGKVQKPDNLVSFWKTIVGPTGASGRMLSALDKAYPRHLTKSELAGIVGIEPSGSTYRNGISKLNKNKLVVKNGNGIKLSDELK